MVLACTWNSWDGYLIKRLLPDSEPIELDPTETAASLLARILSRASDTGLVLFQVNLSYPERLPRERDLVTSALRQRGISVWNGSVHDITKRALQERVRDLGLPHTLVAREGPGSERVIVKNNYNAHSRPERLLSDDQRAALGYPPYSPSPLVDHDEYPVLRRGDVPASWWECADVHIERYIENASGEFFRVFVAGHRAALCYGCSTQPVRRMRGASDRLNFFVSRDFHEDALAPVLLPSIHCEVLRCSTLVADAMKLDFGAIDIVVDDEENVYIVDVNTTPYWGSDEPDNVLQHLRTGLFQDLSAHTPLQ